MSGMGRAAPGLQSANGRVRARSVSATAARDQFSLLPKVLFPVAQIFCPRSFLSGVPRALLGLRDAALRYAEPMERNMSMGSPGTPSGVANPPIALMLLLLPGVTGVRGFIGEPGDMFTELLLWDSETVEFEDLSADLCLERR